MKNRTELAQLFKDQGFKVGAEIGVADGDYSELLCKTIPNLKLYCVDLWRPYREYTDYTRPATFNRMYKRAQEKLSKYDCILIQKYSMEAINHFANGALDFVYIDANHSYKFVKDDIREWSRKVREGGIVAGHDYITSDMGVKEAVDEFVMKYNLKLHTTEEEKPISWYFYI